MKTKHQVLFFFLIFALNACGLKGDLMHPEKNSSPTSTQQTK